MNLREFIKQLEEIVDEYGTDDIDIAVQVPPGTKCSEESWTQFVVRCVSTDGGSTYLQCSK